MGEAFFIPFFYSPKYSSSDALPAPGVLEFERGLDDWQRGGLRTPMKKICERWSRTFLH